MALAGCKAWLRAADAHRIARFTLTVRVVESDECAVNWLTADAVIENLCCGRASHIVTN